MFSPTSIADFLACQHLTALNRAADANEITRPYFDDPGLELLIRLGNAHEQAYLTQLREQGLSVTEIPTDGSRREAAASTIEAIRSGVDVIYQPTFLSAGAEVRTGSGSDRVDTFQIHPVATAPGSDSSDVGEGQMDFKFEIPFSKSENASKIQWYGRA